MSSFKVQKQLMGEDDDSDDDSDDEDDVEGEEEDEGEGEGEEEEESDEDEGAAEEGVAAAREPLSAEERKARRLAKKREQASQALLL